MSLQAFVSGSVQTLAILRLWRLSEMQEVYQGEPPTPAAYQVCRAGSVPRT